MTKIEKERNYKKLTDARLCLLFGGLLSDTENTKIKTKIDNWARKNGLKTYVERVIQQATKS